MLLWTLEFLYLSELVFSFFADIYAGMELLDYMIVLFLVSLGISILFPHLPHWLILPPTLYNSFIFSISLPTLVIWRLFHDRHSDNVWGDILLWFCGFDLHFLMINHAEHLSIWLLAICVSLGKCLFWSSAHFFNWIAWVVYIVRILNPCWSYNLQIFSSI